MCVCVCVCVCVTDMIMKYVRAYVRVQRWRQHDRLLTLQTHSCRFVTHTQTHAHTHAHTHTHTHKHTHTHTHTHKPMLSLSLQVLQSWRGRVEARAAAAEGLAAACRAAVAEIKKRLDKEETAHKRTLGMWLQGQETAYVYLVS